MSSEWSKLDNAAKIFPAADGGADTQVFRFSCELNEPVDADDLARALDDTIDQFDVYRYVMLRGFFWYYLERSDIKPTVREEYKTPCAAVYRGDGSSLMFEVTYYGCRINLEVYHVLSDGTGAMQFLRELVARYLCIHYDLGEVPTDYDASRTQMKDDSFSKYYSSTTKKPKRKMRKRACTLKGARLYDNRLNIITGRMSASAVLALAKSHNVTLTAFLCALLAESISEEVSAKAKKRDIVIAVPVNLRKYFPSESARNFFLLVFAGYNFAKGASFDEVVKKMSEDLKKSLKPEEIFGSLNIYSGVEHNIFAKITPLRLKDIFLRYAYLLSMKQSTATISNVGVVNMPPQMAKYIRAFDMYTGTNKIQICLCTYNGVLSINFSSPFVSTDIQRRFFRKLSACGVRAEVFSNITAEEGAK